MLNFFPASALQAIACAGAAVVIRVVDGALYLKMAVKNRGWLQIIAGDALATHLEGVGCGCCKAMFVERLYDAQHGCIAVKKRIGGGEVGNQIAQGHVVAAMGCDRCSDFFVGDGWKAEIGVYRLYSPRSLPADLQRLSFADRSHPAIDLHIALQNVVVVEVFSVEVAAAKQVIAFGYGAVTGKDKVCAGDELKHQLGGLADGGMRRQSVVAGGDFEAEHGCQQIFRQHSPDTTG